MEKIGRKELNKWEEELKKYRKPKKTWWFRISKRKWFSEWQGLSGNQRSIFMSLCLYAGNKNYCYPSMRRLGKDLNMSKITIFKNIKILKKKGFLEIKKEINQRGKYNKYFLLKMR